MAATIEIGLSTFLVDFTGGQSGLRTPPYTQYSVDLDTCMITLRTTINTMIEELKAVQGPNAGLGADILIFNDPVEHTPDPLNYGIIGRHSYNTVIGAPTSQLEVDAGDALFAGAKVSWTPKTLVGSGGAATLYVRLNATGEPTLETLTGPHDLYSAVWNGAAFTSVSLSAGVDGSGSILQIFFDGDEYEAMQERPVESPTWAAKRHTQFNIRMTAVERLLAGLLTDDDGDAIGPHVHPDGSAGSPGMTFRGLQTLGWWRSGNNLNGSTSGTLRVTISSAGIGVNVMGGLGTPSIYWLGDTVTGFYHLAANRIGVQTNSLLRMEFDAEGNVDLPTNARAQGNRTTARTMTDATQDVIEFNAADTFDIGNGTDNWHDHTGNPADELFTVPTGCDGTYHLLLEFEWEAGVDATNDTEMYIMLNGTVIGTNDIARRIKEVVQNEEYADSCETYAVLAATDVIRVVALVDTSGANPMDLERLKLSIIKVA